MERIFQSLSQIFLRLKGLIFGSRASDKPITSAGDNQLPSSVHEVISDDDLLTEILLRLPVVPTLLLTSVSRRWLSLITDPSFTLRRSEISYLDPPSGLFIQKPPPSSVQNAYFEYAYVSYDTKISPKLITPFPFGSQGNVEIVQSCNGLLLCRDRPEEYWVYNPSLNRFHRIPERPFWLSILGIRLVFDPTKSPHYTVMCSGLRNMYSYSSSSETHNWSDCGAVFTFESGPKFSSGVYCNGAIHWLNPIGVVHYRLDVNGLLVTSIPTSLTFDAESHPLKYKLFAFGDSLFLVCIVRRLISIYSKYLEVYKMRNAYSEWSLKYQVTLKSITRKFTRSWNIFTQELPSDLLEIGEGEREEDLFLVMKLSGQVVKYSFVSKTLDVLFDFGSVPLIEPTTIASSSSCFPFIASFATV
uniref:F-box protein At5g07610-like n=1 Tax=Erigeron canadensis TaxID=72917 RepID=UPI001CB8B280|nr:F-box protein At5g07610-like [Erigeron canadensis]